MKKFLYTIILNIFIFSFASASNIDGMNINLNVNTCNNNNICEAGTEDFLTCPNDCHEQPPTPPVVSPSGSSGSSVLLTQEDFFKNLISIPSYTSATIKWNSSIPTIYVLKWGTTSDYKDGTLKNVHFVKDHSVEITDLESDTVYYFTIESQGYNGQTKIISEQSFRTLAPKDTIAPGNPTNIAISTTISGVVLSWINPTDKDFNYIRITRNSNKWESNPYLGKSVYEGNGQYFRDTNVDIGQKYYYTLFARDTSGNYSSGSLVSITHNPPKDGIVKPDAQIEETVPVLTQLTSVTYTLIQDTERKDFGLGSTIPLNGKRVSYVIANFDGVDHKGDMFLEIKDTYRRVVGRYFFLNDDSNSNVREVVVPPIGGNAYYSISIFKYSDNSPVLIHQGGVQVKTPEKENDKNFSTLPISIAVVATLISIFAIYIKRRKKKILDDETDVG